MTGRAEEVPSQSLSSRAMSFDIKVGTTSETTNVSIPFEQGDVFRHKLEDRKYPLNEVSIPFEQGDVFRPTSSTTSCSSCIVSIPFEQGDVFRHSLVINWGKWCLNPFRAGRCLSTMKTTQKI